MTGRKGLGIRTFIDMSIHLILQLPATFVVSFAVYRVVATDFNQSKLKMSWHTAVKADNALGCTDTATIPMRSSVPVAWWWTQGYMPLAGHVRKLLTTCSTIQL